MGSVLTAAASLCDIVLPTHSDEAPFSATKALPDTAERYLELGVEEVVVKDGADAGAGRHRHRAGRTRAKAGAKVVDATGAAGAFNGAYLSARLAGESLAEAAAEGHRVAGVVIGQRGALVEPALLG